MLGPKKEFSLVAILIIPFLLIPATAEENPELSSILIETDQAEYEYGDSVIITGIVEEKKMPIAALRIFDPDEKIISANEVVVEEDNTFSKIITLDGPMYEKVGTYLVTVNYGKLESETQFQVGEESIELGEDFDDVPEFTFPEVLVITDQAKYQDGDTIVITGLVLSLKDPTVLIGIYDPFGFPAGFYFGEVDENLEFFVSFPVQSGVNFKTEGTYAVSARYGDSEDRITFDFVEKMESIPEEDKDTLTEIIKPPSEDKEKISKINNEKTNLENEKNKIGNQKSIVDPNTGNDKTEKQNSETEKTIRNTKNLSIEDVELGKILNKMNLSCDNSEYTDIISYYDSMGPALIRLCKYGEAISYYDQTLIGNPKNIEALNNKGSALSKLGFLDEAISFFDSSLDVNSKYVPALNNKANAYAYLGNFEEALLLYNDALAISPNDSIVWTNMKMVEEKFLTLKEQKNEPDLVNIKSKQMENSQPEKSQQKPLILSNGKPEPNFIEQLSSAFSSLSETLLSLFP